MIPSQTVSNLEMSILSLRQQATSLSSRGSYCKYLEGKVIVATNHALKHLPHPDDPQCNIVLAERYISIASDIVAQSREYANQSFPS